MGMLRKWKGERALEEDLFMENIVWKQTKEEKVKHRHPPQLFRSFLKKIVISLPLLVGLLAGVNTSAHAASQSVTQAATPPMVTVYLNHRKVHDFNACATPIENCPVIDYVDKGLHPAECQAQGETVTDRGYRNNWWTKLQAPSGKWGWVTNIYIKGGETIAGVPICGTTAPAPQPPPSIQPSKCFNNKTAYLVRVGTTQGTFCFNQLGISKVPISHVTYICTAAASTQYNSAGTTALYQIQYGSNAPGVSKELAPGGIDYYSGFTANYVITSLEVKGSNILGEGIENNCQLR
jgi:hypothetical protein